MKQWLPDVLIKNNIGQQLSKLSLTGEYFINITNWVVKGTIGLNETGTSGIFAEKILN